MGGIFISLLGAQHASILGLGLNAGDLFLLEQNRKNSVNGEIEEYFELRSKQLVIDFHNKSGAILNRDIALDIVRNLPENQDLRRCFNSMYKIKNSNNFYLSFALTAFCAAIPLSPFFLAPVIAISAGLLIKRIFDKYRVSKLSKEAKNLMAEGRDKHNIKDKSQIEKEYLDIYNKESKLDNNENQDANLFAEKNIEEKSAQIPKRMKSKKPHQASSSKINSRKVNQSECGARRRHF